MFLRTIDRMEWKKKVHNSLYLLKHSVVHTQQAEKHKNGNGKEIENENENLRNSKSNFILLKNAFRLF